MTPTMRDWVRDNLTEATPLTVRQLDEIKAQFRQTTLPNQHAA